MGEGAGQAAGAGRGAAHSPGPFAEQLRTRLLNLQRPSPALCRTPHVRSSRSPASVPSFAWNRGASEHQVHGGIGGLCYLVRMSVRVACCLFLLGLPFGAARGALPNIVFILADDLGYGDLSCYGATKVQTPNIDRLAKEGMRFTDAHSPHSVCTPTRYGLLTGRYAWRTWAKSRCVWSDDPLLIDTERMTLPKLLRSAGYAAGCVGKWHLGFGAPGQAGWLGNLGPDYNAPLKPPARNGLRLFLRHPPCRPVPARLHRKPPRCRTAQRLAAAHRSRRASGRAQLVPGTFQPHSPAPVQRRRRRPLPARRPGGSLDRKSGRMAACQSAETVFFCTSRSATSIRRSSPTRASRGKARSAFTATSSWSSIGRSAASWTRWTNWG